MTQCRDRFDRLIVSTMCVSALVGCASSPLSLPRSVSRDDSIQTVSTRSAPRDESAGPEVADVDSASPFVDGWPPASGTSSTGQAGGDQRAAGIAQVSAEASTAQVYHPDTLKLIEEEFRNAPHAEREKWHKILMEVEPHLIPQLLSVRRAMQEREADPLAEALTLDSRQTPHPDEFLSHPPRGEPSPTIVRPLGGSEHSRNGSAMTVLPGRPDRPGYVLDSTRPPTANRPAEAPVAPATHADPAPGGSPEAVEQTASRPSWPPQPPSETASASVRNSGYVEMPDFPDRQVRQTSAAATPDGRYALSNDWDTQLRRVIDIIEDDLAGRPAPTSDLETAEYTRLHTYLRMLYLMDGQQTRSLQAIPDVDPAHQEFWTQLFWGLTNYFDDEGIPDPGHRATETITQLRAAIEKLKPESRLQLRNAMFCHKINSFGNYERFERDEFQPGQAVLVYVEVQNFASEIDSEGLYETRLRSTIELHRAGRGPDMGVLHTQDYAATRDTCRNLRQDYFHSYRLDLPNNLPPGPYTLKLLVEDELSHRIASTSLGFVVR